MDIFLLRSSLAEGGSLSLDGRRLVRALGNKLRLTEEPSFDRMITSPVPAAVQTAELFADRVDYTGVVEVLPSLSGNAPPQVVAPILLAHGTSIVVVGDEPELSALGAFLIGRPTFPQLVHSQVSVIHDRQPAWRLRPGDPERLSLLVA